MHPKELHKGVTKTFSYTLLERDPGSIRVLQIHPGRGRLPIFCTLKHTTIRSQYVCLSYTWGEDTAQRHRIFVNGQRLSIRQNLYDFLITARRLEIQDWLWIDAVCIDQANVPERNHQVQQMAEIYKGAKHVLVDTGPLGASMKWFITANAILLKFWWHIGWWHNESLPPFFTRVNAPRRTLANNLDRGHRRILRPFVKRLGHRPYFKRLWILPELALADEVYVVASRGLIPWNHLARVLDEYPKDSEYVRPSVLDFIQKVSGPSFFVSHLRYTITYSKNLLCADVRDHIYALLGILNPKVPLAVDYHRSPGDLFLDVLAFFDSTHSDAADDTPLEDFLCDVKTVSQALSISVSAICWRCGKRLRADKHDSGATSTAQDATMQRLQTFFLLPASRYTGDLLDDFEAWQANCSICTFLIFDRPAGQPFVGIGTSQVSANVVDINDPWQDTNEQIRCIEIQYWAPMEQHTTGPRP